jgi:Tol biopolymer transport system component
MSKAIPALPRFSVAILAFLLVAATFAARTEAAWPGREGTIFYRGLEPGFESEGWNPTGLSKIGLGAFGTTSQLTSDSDDAVPQVSPDGGLIVLTRGIKPNENEYPTARAIFVMRRDGSGLRQLTSPPPTASDREPTFSASGRRVFFVRLGDETVRGTNHGDIYSVDLNGGELRQITSGTAADFSPAVSPRGRQLVFSRSGWRLANGQRAGSQHIFSIRPDGSRLRDLTPKLEPGAAAVDPDFGPSGRTIAFAIGYRSDSDIFTMRPNGARLKRLTGRRTQPVLHGYGYGEPAFSPAGGRLIAVAINIYNTELARIDLDDPNHPSRLHAGDQPVWAPAPRGR